MHKTYISPKKTNKPLTETTTVWKKKLSNMTNRFIHVTRHDGRGHVINSLQITELIKRTQGHSKHSESTTGLWQSPSCVRTQKYEPYFWTITSHFVLLLMVTAAIAVATTTTTTTIAAPKCKMFCMSILLKEESPETRFYDNYSLCASHYSVETAANFTQLKFQKYCFCFCN